MAHENAFSTRDMLSRLGIVAAASIVTGILAHISGFDGNQVVSCAIFIMTIVATLVFWPLRLAIALVGLAALLGCRVLTLPAFIASCQLDIILFLVGMMVTVGVLKDLGLFTWIIQSVLRMPRMTGTRFVVATAVLGGALAAVVDEVTSIVFLAALIFQVCDTLKIRPTPFVIVAVLATNVGSASTMLGNPVGVLIGYKAGFTFWDFIFHAAPVAAIVMAAVVLICLAWFRPEIQEMSVRLQQRRDKDLGLGPLVQVPYGRGIAVLAALLVLIGVHHGIEKLLGLERNTVLIVAPLFFAGLLMLWRHQRARHYIEQEVEWWTLLFFMMLFAVAGTLEHTGVTSRIAGNFAAMSGSRPILLAPLVIGISAAGSAFVDNVVFVAAAIPVIRELQHPYLWWALLFGACFGGNITMIGSTANIVAIGMLEKRYHLHVSFREWIRLGVAVGIVSCLLALAALALMARFLPAAH